MKGELDAVLRYRDRVKWDPERALIGTIQGGGEFTVLIPDIQPVMFFEIRSDITDVETFAIGKAIRELPRLRKLYGKGRWRKRKGVAAVKLPNGTIRRAELHWYEASGIGKKEFKIKRFLD